MTTLLAWKAWIPDYPDEGQRVVFAVDDEMAAWALRREYELGADDVIETERLPEFDHHAPGPVPVSALLEAGWALTAEELGPEVVEFVKKLEGL